MEGMANRGLPDRLGFHSFLTMDEEGYVTSCHQVPDESFTHVCNDQGDCMCGPQVVFSVFNGNQLPMIRHAPLEGDYYTAREDEGGMWGFDIIDEMDRYEGLD